MVKCLSRLGSRSSKSELKFYSVSRQSSPALGAPHVDETEPNDRPISEKVSKLLHAAVKFFVYC